MSSYTSTTIFLAYLKVEFCVYGMYIFLNARTLKLVSKLSIAVDMLTSIKSYCMYLTMIGLLEKYNKSNVTF